MQITLLEEHQIWGDKALKIMKQYRTPAGASDLAVILGAHTLPLVVDPENNKATEWWLVPNGQHARIVSFGWDGTFLQSPGVRDVAGRPVLPPSVTSQIPENQLRFTRKINGAQIVEYGEYPQSAVDIQKQAELTDMQTRNQLSTTGKKYTFDTVILGGFLTEPCFVHYDEYTDGNARYVYVLDTCSCFSTTTRNGISVESGEKYWLRVEPIEWLADPSGWWVAKDCLFAGIRLSPGIRYDGNFEKTEMFAYLNNYFAQQMLLAPEQKVTVAAAKEVTANREPTVDSVHESPKKESGADFLKDSDKRRKVAHPKSAIINAKSRQR